jgi:hypothetical protein
MTEYDYTKSPCAIDRLIQEIQQSAIVTSLAHCNLYGEALSIFFNADLSDGDKTILDGIVAAHSGTPLAQNQVQTVNINNAPIVTTQYELNDKTLKLGRVKVTIADNVGILYCKVPGTFGADGAGRYVAGGEAIIDTYDPDDYAMVYIEDFDRLIAAAYGAGAGLGRSMTDAEMIAQGDYPAYPILRSYTDDELDAANQGWYFYAEAQGNNLPPYGIMDIEPIGGYGFIPSGLYMKIVVNRPNVATGTTRINIFWGKKE